MAKRTTDPTVIRAQPISSDETFFRVPFAITFSTAHNIVAPKIISSPAPRENLFIHQVFKLIGVGSHAFLTIRLSDQDYLVDFTVNQFFGFKRKQAIQAKEGNAEKYYCHGTGSSQIIQNNGKRLFFLGGFKFSQINPN